MKLKILVFFSVMLFAFTACKKEPVNTVDLGPYGNGVLLLSNGDEDVDGPSGISYIDDKGIVTNGVFERENPDQELSSSALNLYHYGNSYYITSMEGPNHLTVINDRTLKIEYTVKQSGIAGVTYFATTDGKTGYINVTNRRKSGIYPVDLVSKSISGTVITGTSETPLIPICTIGSSVVTSSGKQLLKIDNNTAKVLYTYEENVAGVVTTANKMTWVGVQGFKNKPKFVRLDQDLKELEVVELDASKYRLPANGILTASGNDDFIYWQETSSGKICRFNVATKTAEVFVDPSTEGIVMMTAWKVNPQNGDLYLIDTPGMFMGENESNLFIFDKTGKRKKEIRNVGYTVSDIAFPR